MSWRGNHPSGTRREGVYRTPVSPVSEDIGISKNAPKKKERRIGQGVPVPADARAGIRFLKPARAGILANFLRSRFKKDGTSHCASCAVKESALFDPCRTCPCTDTKRRTEWGDPEHPQRGVNDCTSGRPGRLPGYPVARAGSRGCSVARLLGWPAVRSAGLGQRECDPVVAGLSA